MSNVPLRPCSIPACPSLTSRGRCDARRRESDALRGSSAERGYDADHRRLRILCFVRDRWRCVDCGWAPEIVAQFRSWGTGVRRRRTWCLRSFAHRHNRGERHPACRSSGAHPGAAGSAARSRQPPDAMRSVSPGEDHAGVRAGEGVAGLIFKLSFDPRPWPTLARKFPGFELFQLWITK